MYRLKYHLWLLVIFIVSPAAAQNNEPLFTLEYAGGILWAGWTPNASELMVVTREPSTCEDCPDYTFSRYDAQTFEPVATFDQQESGVAEYYSDFAFSPDGQYLLLENTNQIWHVESGERWTQAEPRSENAALWHPSANRVLFHTQNTLSLWDMTGQEPVWSREFDGGLTSPVWSPDGASAAVLLSETTMLILDSESGDTRFEVETGAVEQVSWSADGSRLLGWTRFPFTALVIEVATGEAVFSLTTEDATVDLASLNADGRSILANNLDDIYVFDSAAGSFSGMDTARLHIPYTQGDASRWVMGSVWLPDSEDFITASIDGKGARINSASGEAVFVREGLLHTNQVGPAHFVLDPTHRYAVSAGFSRDIIVFELGGGETMVAGQHDDELTATGEPTLISHVAWRSDGNQLLTVAAPAHSFEAFSNELKVWEIED